jgi:hypothetical protein
MAHAGTAPAVDSKRRLAFITGLAVAAMAVLTPFALYGALRSLVIPGDAAATVAGIAASPGLFRAGIVAFLVVILLDLLLAWTLYRLLAPVSTGIALLTAWLRVAFAAIFASALISLVYAGQLIAGADQSGLPATHIEALVMASVTSFDTGWVAIALSVFSFHLFGLGYLMIRSVNAPSWLGILLVVAGAGYLFDGLATIAVPDYTWTVAVFTFIGEPILGGWAFWRAVKGFAPESRGTTEELAEPAAQPAPVAS